MRSLLHRLPAVLTASLLTTFTGCHTQRPDPRTLVFLIESSPNNLDLRQGTDAQSERVGGLVYDALAHKDDHFVLQPMLATSWDRPDPLTWVFHIRPGVRFHDGKPLTAADVAWSIRSMTDGTLITAKGGALASIRSLDTPDPLTVVAHLSHPDNALLFNLSDGLFGVVENGAGAREGDHPVGTGPFRFISATPDKNVVLARNESYWGGAPHIPKLRFNVVPDTITAALEIRKGSADAESNVLTPDMVAALRSVPTVRIASGPGSVVMYANFNVADPALHDPRVRQAIACAIDRPALISALFHAQAEPADTLLPAHHWAAADPTELAHYPHDPARARQLLLAAGLSPDAHGILLHLTLKTSTDETTRLVAQAMQDQLLAAGIALSLRPAEFGTFYADITHGTFQMYMLRWIGVNEDPSIFRYAFDSASQPPHGANRGHYINPQLDHLLAHASLVTAESQRRPLYIQAQQVLARDLPTLPLWYVNNTVAYSQRVSGVTLNAGGNFDFLRTAELH